MGMTLMARQVLECLWLRGRRASSICVKVQTYDHSWSTTVDYSFRIIGEH